MLDLEVAMGFQLIIARLLIIALVSVGFRLLRGHLRMVYDAA